MPAEIKGLNWGAFLLSWIWLTGMKPMVGILTGCGIFIINNIFEPQSAALSTESLYPKAHPEVI